MQATKYGNRIKKTLNTIFNRYFFQNKVLHHFDCNIYRRQDVCFCSCGLLHDLEYLDDYDLMTLIFPDYHKHFYLQENQRDIEDESPEDLQMREEECSKLLSEVFGPIKVDKFFREEKLAEYKHLVQEIFGHAYDDALNKLIEETNEIAED